MENNSLETDPRNLEWEENSTENQHYVINGIGNVGYPSR